MYIPTRGGFSFIRDALAEAMLALYDEEVDVEALTAVLTDAIKELDQLQEWVVESLDQFDTCGFDDAIQERAELETMFDEDDYQEYEELGYDDEDS